jgi:repressor LexA
MTPRQKQLLDYVRAFTVTNGGVSPTYQQIAAGLGLSSKSTVHMILKTLQSDGHIRFRRGRARSVEIVHQSCPHCGGHLERADHAA